MAVQNPQAGDPPHQDLISRIRQEPGLDKALQESMVAQLGGIPEIPDTLVYRLTVGALAAAVLLTLVGAIIVASMSHSEPEIFTAMGSAAVGALAGLLSPISPSKLSSSSSGN